MTTAFEAYITNLGEYSEDVLEGEWLAFPCSEEDFQECLKRISVDGKAYDEWFVTDYSCEVIDLNDILGEYTSYSHLEETAERIAYLEREYPGLIQAVDEGLGEGEDLVNGNTEPDEYAVWPNVESDFDLGYQYAHESGVIDEVPEWARDFFDYEKFGQRLDSEWLGAFYNGGYIVKD